MAWSGSAMFQAWPQMLLEHSVTEAQGYDGIETDTIKVALYDNDITPDKDAAVALTGYNAATSAWVSSGNEVTDSDGSSDWSAGGVALAGKAVTDQGSGVTMFDATDTTHSNTVTLTNAYGCLVYDDDITAGTVPDQGISYHYFGGAQSVTTGTFTIVWHANGLFRITV
jgi:hypothetical protein